MSKLVINKHYRSASSITENSFFNEPFDETHPNHNGELLKEGEIVISNEQENPGLFIFTAGPEDDGFIGTGGKVINVTSPDNIHLTSGYTPSTEESPIISSGDSVETTIGKIDRKFEKQAEYNNSFSGQINGLISDIIAVDEKADAVRDQISAETVARENRDNELNELISANTESISEISGATSKESMDEFVTENFEGGYDPSTREIKLTYKLGDGTVKEDLMVVDVTDFTTQIDFLSSTSAYTVTNPEGEDHDGVHYEQYDQVLVLTFRVTDSGVQHDETIYYNITSMTGRNRVLSEDEYDALTEEEKNNGCYYYTYEEE